MEQSIDDIRFLLANRLKNRRKELNLSQQEVADRMGVLRPNLARLEALGPPIETLLQWCTALDMKLTIEPMKNTALVDKALQDPDALEELIDAPPEKTVEVATLEEVLEAGDDPTKAIVITDKTTVKKIREAAPGEPVEFCKHGFVKGFCKKGCK